ncbi:ABC transporter ATP-binding protein [Nevskia sp.]|uniref:ABC transporter ATP-binding protein n=1 Tax=Nevskia sp. TaxID=1929292 RepID=UPI0025E718DC|nr:ABC transporter ATP-binding protein [Nevskia sp.]
MLQATDLTKRYGDHLALNSLNLKVEPGEIFCLLGGNGAGKTTTINLFLNFIQPTSGQVSVNGIDVVAQPLEAKRHIAYIPETVMLYGSLSGIENLEYFTTLALGQKRPRAELLDLLVQAGLAPDAAPRRVAGYSKGMRQKVGIAIAMAKNTKALLLDEPTSGLDPQAANEFARLLEQMKARGVAILMTTHDLFLAKQTGTRVGIMQRGVLAATFDTDTVGHAELERIYLDLSYGKKAA